MEQRIRENGLSATLRVPDGPGPFPGVLALGGSDGGTPEYFLDLLVGEGFACLALTYWGTRETQLTFTDIPLERVERGLRWLTADSRVVANNGRVGLIGASRGGELALLAAAAFPSLVGPVVVYTPSHAVCVEPETAWPNALGATPRVVPGPASAGARVLEAGESLCATFAITWGQTLAWPPTRWHARVRPAPDAPPLTAGCAGPGPRGCWPR